MKVRAALILALVLVVVLLTPRAAGAQPAGKVWRVGVLYYGVPSAGADLRALLDLPVEQPKPSA